MAVIPVNVEDQELEKESERKGSDLKGVELLADMFMIGPNGNFFVPKPNIADMFDDDTLLKVGLCVKDGYESDWDSMDEWRELVDFGLELVKQETTSRSEPWDGASNFKSPELMKAALKFSDRASSELLRGYNILKTKVVGDDPHKVKFDTGERVAEFMNWQLNVEMKEWREEQEKLIYDLPYVGTVFKKTFFDAQLGRNTSKLITYPNFAVNQDAESIARLRRFSELHPFSENEVIEKQRQGIWLDIKLSAGNQQEGEGTEAESDKMTTFIEQDGFYDLDDDGLEEPYTFVAEESTGKIVRIMPRFEPKDVLVKGKNRATTLDKLISETGLEPGEREVVRITPEENITKYGFIHDPQGGFLDVGYTHLLSALTAGINATTNQLMDAGTLAIRGGGWLSKGFRRKMGNSSFKMGEWKQTGVSAQELQTGIMPLPVKEPSQAVFALMQFLIGSAQELAASTDLKGTLGANAPVGTTLALIDEQLQSTGAIVKRIYRSMSSEFRKQYILNSKFVDPTQYQEILDNPEANFEADFNVKGMDIIPTASPEVATKTQRVIIAQAEISQIQNVMFAGGNPEPIIKSFFELIGSNIAEEVFPEETPEQELQSLLSKNPQLEALITGEQERTDLLAAADADAIAKEQARKDLESTDKSDKISSEIDLNEAKTIRELELAETEQVKNDISIYTTAANLDGLDIQNKQSLRALDSAETKP